LQPDVLQGEQYGHAGGEQSGHQRLGGELHAPDVDDLGLKIVDQIGQGVPIGRFGGQQADEVLGRVGRSPSEMQAAVDEGIGLGGSG